MPLISLRKEDLGVREWIRSNSVWSARSWIWFPAWLRVFPLRDQVTTPPCCIRETYTSQRKACEALLYLEMKANHHTHSQRGHSYSPGKHPRGSRERSVWADLLRNDEQSQLLIEKEEVWRKEKSFIRNNSSPGRLETEKDLKCRKQQSPMNTFFRLGQFAMLKVPSMREFGSEKA